LLHALGLFVRPFYHIVVVDKVKYKVREKHLVVQVAVQKSIKQNFIFIYFPIFAVRLSLYHKKIQAALVIRGILEIFREYQNRE
jgi:hypothetical protein